MGQLGKRTKRVSFYFNSAAAAAWFLLLCASGSFASYMLLYAASYPQLYYNQCGAERAEWARGAGSHNDEGEREGSCTNGKKAWRGMVVTVVGGYNNGRHSCVVGEGHGGPLGRDTTTPAELHHLAIRAEYTPI